VQGWKLLVSKLVISFPDHERTLEAITNQLGAGILREAKIVGANDKFLVVLDRQCNRGENKYYCDAAVYWRDGLT